MGTKENFLACKKADDVGVLLKIALEDPETDGFAKIALHAAKAQLHTMAFLLRKMTIFVEALNKVKE